MNSCFDPIDFMNTFTENKWGIEFGFGFMENGRNTYNTSIEFIKILLEKVGLLLEDKIKISSQEIEKYISLVCDRTSAKLNFSNNGGTITNSIIYVKGERIEFPINWFSQNNVVAPSDIDIDKIDFHISINPVILNKVLKCITNWEQSGYGSNLDLNYNLFINLPDVSCSRVTLIRDNIIQDKLYITGDIENFISNWNNNKIHGLIHSFREVSFSENFLSFNFDFGTGDKVIFDSFLEYLNNLSLESVEIY